MKTLDLEKAAEFLGAHKETIRRLVATGRLPGVKIGRKWIFIEQDLAMYIRNKYFYVDASQGDHRSNTKWHSTKERKFGGLISITKEKEYEKLLGLK
ncbi:DNA-binding protein [Legionella taurinensis]|uniref:DNA-binding protein n=1 Tax=Legionella taurinensis TaxID=70611 RepID=A0AB38N384_9GAMM|nr:helix-turn-helix domain-containing protein [Legionella taurinensis]MDX1838850.1 helix-turn-helix domain-containing protein [Legionella taurinensis]PUT38565.1 DNA-binding protein [Legionella taurinensis]PUT39333.1 DNA-binding protein [Legionella taurinensis]PUT41057.1 DNA-binding protein [Legionella taurinensis]PUT44487.1 DNA-binding protein [Legionella taurinensis]